MVKYFLWREANWSLYSGSSKSTSKSRAISQSSPNLAQGKSRACHQLRLHKLF